MERTLKGHCTEMEEIERKLEQKGMKRRWTDNGKDMGTFVLGGSRLTADKVCMKPITEPAPFHFLPIPFYVQSMSIPFHFLSIPLPFRSRFLSISFRFLSFLFHFL